jgi:phosphate uptake regulator
LGVKGFGIGLKSSGGTKKMEYRKLISFGKSSFVISLPKSWINKHKLVKGDLLYLQESETDLIISPKEQEESEDREITINVDGKTMLQLTREINAAYIENNRIIKLNGKELEAKSKDLLVEIRQLIALEVMEFDSKKIVTKDFLNMHKISILELIKKIDIIIRSMISDCSKCFESNSSEHIELRDLDVNRLSFLVFRTIRYGYRHQSLMLKAHNLRAIDLLNLYLLTFHLEHIADEAKRISRAIVKVKLKVKEKEDFLNLLKQAEELYLHNIKAFYANSASEGLKKSMIKTQLIQDANKYYEKMTKNGHNSYMVDRFRRLVGSIHEMGRLSYQCK